MSNLDSKPDSVPRRAAMRRRSRETEVLVDLDLDPPSPSAQIDSGIGFFDHLLSALAVHAGWDLRLVCRGDLEVDDHHSVEDTGLALGETFARALAAGGRPARFGSAYAPLDEALARAVVDLSGRAYCRAALGLDGARLGGLSGEMVGHFLASFAQAARLTLHVDVLSGENAHHKAEASFKALALALRQASSLADTERRGEPGGGEIASTKGAVLLEEIEGSRWEALASDLRGRKNART
jgi:imidazoleglycerol-phosphate dehydratase